MLLTLGRLPKALDLARAFAARGDRVLVAEPYQWHLCRVSRAVERCFVVPPPSTAAERYLDALESVIREHGVDLVVPVSEETLFVAGLRPRLPAGVGLYAMPQPLLLALHSKHEFPALVQSFGLAAPPTYLAGTPAAAALLASRDCVVKPVRSCSGRGLVYLGAGAPVPAQGEAAVVQQRVRGRLLSSFSVLRDGAVVTTVVYRGTIMAGTVAVGFERVDEAGIAAWVTEFARQSRYTGFVSFDFIVDDDDRPWAIECNPRVTSGIHFLRHEDLAAVIRGEAGAPVPRLREHRRLQQFFPALTETQGSVFSDRFRANLRTLVGSRDVSWATSDPWPLLTMPLTSLGIMVRAATQRRSMGEVATDDIVWSDPPAGVG